ncbi:MAG TPA: flagellar protein FlbB [Alphaproteobacteria bacterium]|nr:flagellar protein FlbB [Alphaproteobacteria bacterium]
MIAEKLKIFPLLILVAMLAFSVRLAEVVGGVRTLSSGSAMAEETAPKPDDAALAAPGEKKAPEEKPAEEATKETKAEETKEGDAKKAEPKKAEKKEAKAKTPDTIWKDAADSDVDSASAVKAEMFEDLAKRRDALDVREKELITREALIKAAEAELDRKYQELDTIRGEIKTLLTEQSEEEKARITSLVKIYEGMKPAQAANIFNTLDLDILVEVMTQMSERKLAPVLAVMDPERARTVTIMMAEQKKLPALPESN